MLLPAPLVALAILAIAGSPGAADAQSQATGRQADARTEILFMSQQANEVAAFRKAITARVSSGTIVRVEGVATATPGPRLAGYLARPQTERALSGDELATLLALLRADSGFNDGENVRCPPGVSVGFRLAGAGETAEVVIDFECNKLILRMGDTEVASEFGPSRLAFVAFVKKALPGDADIQALD